MTTKSEQELREEIKFIVTRVGNTVRIPGILESELDDLTNLFNHELELAKIEAKIEDALMWIGSTKYKKDKVVQLKHLELHLTELGAQKKELMK